MDPKLENDIQAYAMDQLGEAEKEKLEQLALEDKQLAAELMLVTQLVRMGHGEQTDVHAPGWDQLQSRLTKTDPSSSEVEDIVRLSSVRERWRRRLAPMLQMAAGAAIAVVILQSLPDTSSAPENQDIYQLASESHAGLTAKVVFKDSANHGDVRALLKEIGANVYSGPGSLGVYSIKFDTLGLRTSGIEALEAATDLVEYANAND